MDMPTGFITALGMNSDAAEQFSLLPHDSQKAIIEKARNVRSKEEMRNLVNNIAMNLF